MIAILDKIFKALISLFVLSALNERGIDVLEEYFYLAILYQLALFAYRPFALAKYIPMKVDYLYYLIWLVFLLILAYILKIEMYWLIFLAPLQAAGYYLESHRSILYYILSMISVVFIYLIFGISKTTYMLLIAGNIVALLITVFSKEKYTYNRASLIVYSGPLILNSIAVLLYTRIDVFILDYFSGGNSNEDYLTSVRLFDYCAMLITIVSNYALIKVMNSQRSRLYSPRALVAMSCLGILAVFLLLPWISKFFKFNTNILVIYLGTLPFISLGLIRNNYLLKLSRTSEILKFSLVGVGSMVMLGITAYHFLGTIGLAWSTLVVQIFLIVISWNIVKEALITANEKVN